MVLCSGLSRKVESTSRQPDTYSRPWMFPRHFTALLMRYRIPGKQSQISKAFRGSTESSPAEGQALGWSVVDGYAAGPENPGPRSKSWLLPDSVPTCWRNYGTILRSSNFTSD